MGKPLSEHDVTLHGRKQARDAPAGGRAMEPVHEGGHVRRIVFPADADNEPIEQSEPQTLHTAAKPSDRSDAAKAPVQEEPQDEPAVQDEPSAPRREPRAPDRQAGRYQPRHRADLEAIHDDIDRRILRRRPTSTSEVKRHTETTVYRTERGEVRRSEYETSEGERKALYLRHQRQGAPVERRFTGAEIDRVVKDVPDTETLKTTRKTTRTTKTATGPVKTAPEPRTDDTWMGYKGDVHTVIELEGIGPVYAERLNDLGIESTDRLCYEDGATLAKRLGVPEKTVATWKSMAELVKVSGIGPQYAEALARAGVHGIQSLKDKSPARIAEQVNAYLDSLDSTVIKSRPSAKRVETWQKAAKKMRRVRRKAPQK